MKYCQTRILLTFAFIFCGVANVFAAASGNVRLETPDAATVGMGSANVGDADRPSAVYYNPAGLTQIDNAQLSVGMTVLQPQINYKSPSGDEVQSRKNTYVFPHVYFTSPVVKNKFYIGVGENSNWGSGNEWAGDSISTFTRYSMTHSEFENKDALLTGAYKITDQWSVGVGIDNDDSKIEKSKKLKQGGIGDDAGVQLKAKDNAWGYRLSTMFKLNNQHQFGLMYRSAIHHKYEGKLYFDGLNDNGNIFGAGVGYQTVFGGSSFETKATQKFTLPQSVVLGYSFKPTTKWKVNFDLEWLDWSSVKQSAINFPDVTDSTQSLVLAANNPQSKDWRSVWSESIGVQYSATDYLRLRAGYAYHQTPIAKDSNWDTTYPDNNSHSFTAGLGFDLNPHLTLDLAYVGDLYETRKVETSQDSTFGANLSGEYEQFVNLGLATLTYKF